MSPDQPLVWGLYDYGNQYTILTSRRRSIIALAHSVVFLVIAWRGVLNAKTVAPIWTKSAAAVSSSILLLIYLVVSAVLIQLVRVSRDMREKLYFGFCRLRPRWESRFGDRGRCKPGW